MELAPHPHGCVLCILWRCRQSGLRRSRFPTEQIYGADLGAALGCVAVVAILSVLDGPTTVIVTVPYLGCPRYFLPRAPARKTGSGLSHERREDLLGVTPNATNTSGEIVEVCLPRGRSTSLTKVVTALPSIAHEPGAA